jgi:CheY-like chemotaxis protein
MMEHGLQVLLVEDDVGSAELLAELLVLEGHDVRIAPDGPTALRLSDEVRPDVAILDLGLPGGVDGFAVARQLRQHHGDERRPLLVVLTGQRGDDVRARSEREGVDLYLTKPTEPEALRAVLRRFSDILHPPGMEGAA